MTSGGVGDTVSSGDGGTACPELSPGDKVIDQLILGRQVKYRGNAIEGEHGRTKRVLDPKRKFKNRASAYRVLKGMEARHSTHGQGEGTMFAYRHPNPDAVIVNRLFENA